MAEKTMQTRGSRSLCALTPPRFEKVAIALPLGLQKRRRLVESLMRLSDIGHVQNRLPSTWGAKIGRDKTAMRKSLRENLYHCLNRICFTAFFRRLSYPFQLPQDLMKHCVYSCFRSSSGFAR